MESRFLAEKCAAALGKEYTVIQPDVRAEVDRAAISLRREYFPTLIAVTFLTMRFGFLVETYATERVKVVSVWSEFRDGDLPVRPRDGDPRGRSVHEQMVHQCVSEDLWFRNMLEINVGAPPLPPQETKMEFIRRYAEDSGKRLTALQSKDEAWWEGDAKFFDVARSRAWVMVRRMTHTSPRTTDGHVANAGTLLA